MKITVPTVSFQAGRRHFYSLYDFSISRRSILIDVGRFYFDAYFGKRTVAYDFKAARRAHGLVGLIAFPVLVAAFLILAAPLLALNAIGKLAWDIAGLLADYVFQPITNVLVPVSRSGIRSTLKALVKEVTQ